MMRVMWSLPKANGRISHPTAMKISPKRETTMNNDIYLEGNVN